LRLNFKTQMLFSYLIEIYPEHSQNDLEVCLAKTYSQTKNQTPKQVLEAITGLELYTGTSGYIYAWWSEKNVPNAFYPKTVPAKNLLQEYAKTFDFVEINGTFYKLPTEGAVKVWHDTTPTHFRFAVKLSKYATEAKKLIDFEKSMQIFWERVHPLANKLLGILVQLPPSFKYTTKRGQEMVGRVKTAVKIARSYPCDFYFEFRDSSWFTGQGLEELKLIFTNSTQCSMVFVNSLGGLGDLEAGWSPSLDLVGGLGRTAYFRLHGEKYQGLYTKGALQNAFDSAKGKVDKMIYAFDNTDNLVRVGNRNLPPAVVNALMVK